MVDAHLRPDEFVLDQMAQEHLQRLPVLLVHGEQEKGQHHQNHTQRRRGGPQARFCQKEKRHAYQRRRSETDHLSFGQPEQNLALYPAQVLRDRYISQCFTPPLVGAEQGFCKAAGLEQGVAQQGRIAHAPPDGRGYVVAGCGDALHQHRVDAHANHNEEGLEAQGQQRAKVVLPRGAPLPVDHRGKGNRPYGGHQIHLYHSAVDHQEDADRKYLRTQPHEHALEPQPQQGAHAPVGKLGLQIAYHAGDVDACVRDDDPRLLADHILRHIEHRHDDVPGVGDDQHGAEGLENPLEENPCVKVVEVVFLNDELDQLLS